MQWNQIHRRDKGKAWMSSWLHRLWHSQVLLPGHLLCKFLKEKLEDCLEVRCALMLMLASFTSCLYSPCL